MRGGAACVTKGKKDLLISNLVQIADNNYYMYHRVDMLGFKFCYVYGKHGEIDSWTYKEVRLWRSHISANSARNKRDINVNGILVTLSAVPKKPLRMCVCVCVCFMLHIIDVSKQVLSELQRIKIETSYYKQFIMRF